MQGLGSFYFDNSGLEVMVRYHGHRLLPIFVRSVAAKDKNGYPLTLACLRGDLPDSDPETNSASESSLCDVTGEDGDNVRNLGNQTADMAECKAKSLSLKSEETAVSVEDEADEVTNDITTETTNDCLDQLIDEVSDNGGVAGYWRSRWCYIVSFKTSRRDTHHSDWHWTRQSHWRSAVQPNASRERLSIRATRLGENFVNAGSHPLHRLTPQLVFLHVPLLDRSSTVRRTRPAIHRRSALPMAMSPCMSPPAMSPPPLSPVMTSPVCSPSMSPRSAIDFTPSPPLSPELLLSTHTHNQSPFLCRQWTSLPSSHLLERRLPLRRMCNVAQWR